MRLTLRTLLAYLDDVLEPEDARKLSEKIDESEFATGLVHRIRVSIRHLRLAAPKVDGRGMGFDPNTVADYLDSTLPAEQVPDFEKICLESDINLAEAAACHQILTLVLGEPADADPATRERMYRIIDQKDKQQSLPAKNKPALSPPKRKVDRAAPQTPKPKAQTIRRTKKTNQPNRQPVAKSAKSNPNNSKTGLSTVVVAMFVLLSVVGGLRLIGEFNESHPVYSFFASPRSRELAQALSLPIPGASEEVSDATSQDQNLANSDNALDAQPPAPNTTDTGPADQKPADTGEVIPALPTPPIGLRPNNEKPTKPGKKQDTSQAPKKNTTTTLPSPNKVDEPNNNNPSPSPAPSIPGKEPLPAENKTDTTSSKNNNKDPQNKTGEAIGRYVSEKDVLLRYEEKSKSWYRVPQRASLSSGDQLMVLPTFRPSVLLSGIQLSFAGNNLVQLNKKGQQDFSLSVEYGRIILVAVGNKKTSIQLNLSGRTGVALFEDSDSALAIEVRSFLPLGENPETSKTETVVELFTLSGMINWSEAGSKPIAIPAQEALGMVGDQPGVSFSIDTLPAWIESKEVNKIDRLASEDIASTLSLDRPADIALQELTNHRRTEVRSLAVRCLASFEIYEPIIAILSDKWHQSTWNEHFSVLSESVARSPESAATVRKTLETLRNKDTDKLYRMLWGYSNQQLEDGESKNLLLSLNHESLDIRVLAFNNLRKITGFTQGYRPEFTESRRKRHIQRWIERYEEGAVLHKTEPIPLEIPVPKKQLLDENEKPKREKIKI